MDSGRAGGISVVLISYPHLHPQLGVAGTRFTGERGNVAMRGYDKLRKAAER